MPYEARLTLEGPQLSLSYLRHIFIESGRDRSLGWSGGDELAPRMTKWEPPPPEEIVSPMSRSRAAHTDRQPRYNGEESTENDAAGPKSQLKRRTPPLVYILGFHSERAMQSFVHFWHRRSVEVAGASKA